MDEKKQHIRPEIEEESLIRIMTFDIPGNKQVLVGLTWIKGISWSFSNAICNSMKINKTKKIKELSKEEIAKISEFIENPKLHPMLLNRRCDREGGITGHVTGPDLELKKEFDVKRLKKIRSYKGLRHATGQPVRGQRTKSHFRKNKTVGVQKKKAAPAKGKK